MVVVVVVVGRFASGGLWEWVTVAVGSGCAAEIGGGSDLVGQGECVVEIWWWLRFCDGGGRERWIGFVIWKRKARGDMVEQWPERWV